MAIRSLHLLLGHFTRFGSIIVVVKSHSDSANELLNQSPDYFNDAELNLAVAGRSAAELEMKMCMKKAAVEHRKLMTSLNQASQNGNFEHRANYIAKFNDFSHKLKLNAERIMYPGQPLGLRQKYLDHFGCTAWTEEALKLIRDSSSNGVVELGAGSGKWANALRLRGVNVKAYDNMSFLPESNPISDPNVQNSNIISETTLLAQKAGVEIGNEEIFSKQKSLNKRSLLFVYPPIGDMAYECLKEYSGNTLIYIGEGRNGVNANHKFFNLLENHYHNEKESLSESRKGEWSLYRMENLSPFPGGHEKLYIFKRKKGWGGIFQK